MITQRDNSPEQRNEYMRLQARSWLVENVSLETEAALYGEFEHAWKQPAVETQPLQGTGSLIDHTFLEANIRAQTAELASDRAISDAQRRVAEVFDEFSA